jgi:hypothetical protein
VLPTRKTRVFVCKKPTDMRGSFDSLYKRTKDIIGVDPKSGHMFLFINKNRNRVKILVYDGTGFVVIAKRLDKGSFSHLILPIEKILFSPKQSLHCILKGQVLIKDLLSHPTSLEYSYGVKISSPL